MLHDGKISNLQQLVFPMSREEFLGHYVRQSPIFIHGAKSTRVAGLVDVNDISELVQQRLSDDRVWIVHGGRRIASQFYTAGGETPRIEPSLVRRLLNRGASLIVRCIDELHPRLGDLGHALELEFSCNVWANAYVTLKEGGAFDIHYDDHDVIVLQIQGSKRWRLFGMTEEFPLRSGKKLFERPPTAEQEVDVLTAGEVLFIPRGVWHRAEVVDSPSFHITFGVGGVTGMDFVKSSIGDLGEEPIFRKYLPRFGGDQVLLDHERALKSILHDWVDRMSSRAFLANSDAARRNRSRAILWNSINIEPDTKLWIASRRLLPAQLLDESDGIVTLGGERHRFDSIELLIVKILFKRVVLCFNELVVEARAAGAEASSVDFETAVIRLVEHGVLNIEMKL